MDRHNDRYIDPVPSLFDLQLVADRIGWPGMDGVRTADGGERRADLIVLGA
ncbi:hypothetical protein AB0I35_12755 [Nocardia sp. NPDC050378]|uniref:hypothetical protein n=1 Tax=Nocardia sp. NPDC050378 TaxID=3155400 RepID=UPI0033C6199A